MWEMIKNLVGAWFDAARSLGPGLLGRMLSGIGIGFASYEYLLPQIVEYLQNFIYALPEAAISMLGALGFDVALTMIFSALAVKLGTRINPIRLRPDETQ